MPLPILSIAEMREWESATWATGQTEKAVIAAVGEYLTRRALSLTRPGEAILLLAGKGNNGNDARAMLPGLQNREAHLITVKDPEVAAPELNPALRRRPRLIIDALFGLGLNRELSRPWVDFIQRVNQSQLDVMAVDVPSGLNADTGHPQPVAMRARVTVTIGAPKRGLLLAEAAEWVGLLEVASDVGLNPYPFHADFRWTTPEDFLAYPPRRPIFGHKGTFGHVAIVAGSVGYHGASVLAARGGQRARPGLMTVITQPDVYPVVAGQLQAAMVRPWEEQVDWSQFSAILIGPGLAAPTLPPSMPQALRHLWKEHDAPVVVDASALTWLPEGNGFGERCRVIMPHPGEAARLLETTVAEVQGHRPQALRALSKKFGNCWVVLKGRHTLVGRESGDVFVNSSGNPGLAQGGSGDLLAGYLAGWLAQPALQTEPLRAIRYAVWEHGHAAERLSVTRENWSVEELADALGPLQGG
jgi:ADP-dependent NAD(P)H-hydrate dehydratase / NAD(P)H-hydrate epimerase